MKGYIYTMFPGADPGAGWKLNDPIFGRRPTLGACMPNIRRVVDRGDYIFVVSGRVKNLKQYVVGGFKVDQKLDALAAYQLFPENRQLKRPDGSLAGNIIIDEKGNHLEIDYHDNFARRVENYIVGADPIVIDGASSIERAREQTIPILSDIFEKPGSRIIDIIGRWRKLDQEQIGELVGWMKRVGER